ncbi:MAG: prolipoprotein diacylglyceryl transferase [Candidatus Omnitrophica bacterium]|nr:prolipoprotein diacylglyceryl transferase [Candidatus Omnitrophota bacterium]
MHPQICKIGPFTVYSYGLMLAVAFVVSSALASLQARRQQINPDTIFNFLFLTFISGVIGARIFYIIENLSYYIKNPLEIIMLQQGGLSWFGGLIAGVSLGVRYLRNKKLPVYRVLDLVSPYLALGQAIGRVGCYLNGCCFGKVLVPVQILSSLILIFIFIVLRFLQERPHSQGQIFFTYLLLYSVKRFFIEFWRADNPRIFQGLTLFQIISIAIFCLSLVKLLLIKKAKAKL